MSDTYEQIHVVEEDIDVDKMAFVTIFGTFKSLVMQIGNCNALSTFQHLMTLIFRNQIGQSVHVYLDDIFIYLSSIKEHEKHLQQVFEILHEAHLFLSRN